MGRIRSRRPTIGVSFPQGLGLVRYHVGSYSASHEDYMKELGALRRCQYPGFPNDPLDPFVRLAHDLGFAGEFVSGDARMLIRASQSELATGRAQVERELKRCVGDTRTLDEMRRSFREHAYGQVVHLAQTLVFPDQMTPSQRRMLEIARARIESGSDRS